MPDTSVPDMLVLLDDHPSSAPGLAFAESYSDGFLVLSSWSAAPGDLAGEVQTSIASEPTIAEAMRTAAQRRISIVAIRRDLADPQQLLGDLLVATAQHSNDDIPGFAVLLADGPPRPVRRILAIADQRVAPMSGLSAYLAVSVADRAGAILDVLVIGSADPTAGIVDDIDMLAVNREQELLDRAVARAKARGVTVNWLPASGVADPWLVINDQLAQHDYDLVTDDLGQVRLGGRLGMDRTIAGALSPGEAGEIPLRLLTEVPIPLLLVIDEIRLGIAPATLLKAGTAAALGLGIIAPASVAAAPSRTVAAEPTVEDEAQHVATALEEALGIAREEEEAEEASAERAEDADNPSRGGAQTGGRVESAQSLAIVPTSGSTADTQAQAAAKEEKKGTQAPKPPKGGADPSDLAKARRQAEQVKTELAKDKKKQEKAEQAAQDAQEQVVASEEQVVASEEQAEAALAELQDATAALADAQRAANGLRMGLSETPSVLPPEVNLDRLSEASRLEQAAQTRLDAAVTAGQEAVDLLSQTEQELAEAQEGLAAAEEKLASRGDDVSGTKEEYKSAKEKVAVYKESLAKSRQSPVKKGNYRLTARFGQHGWYWSGGVHTGLDFAGKSGTGILAAASGKVVSTGWQGAYGNQIVIDHGNGYQTTYNHLSSIGVSVGQQVTAGDRIGSMGSTGNSTGTHLHFEVTKDGKFMDPETWLGW